MHTLRARSHRALLDLYAIDTHLQTAQSHLSQLRAQVERLRGQQARLEQELSATRHTLSVSQQRLGASLRLLYKQDDVTAFAVILGAQNLDDAVSKLDALSSMTDSSRQIVQVTLAAQLRLSRLKTTLVERRQTLDAALREAQQTETALLTARGQRLSFISSLRRQERLKTSQIAALQARAVRVERKSSTIQQRATVTAPDPPATPATTNTVTTNTGSSITVTSTGYSLGGHTSTGIPVGWGVVAVDPSVIPLGTRLTIPGYGDGVAADTGSGVRGADIDIWFPTLAQARAWGRRTVTITLH